MVGQASSSTVKEKRSFTRRSAAPSFLELGAKVFLGTDAARVVAITACYPQEGVTYVSTALQKFLSEDAGSIASLMTGSVASLVSADAFLETIPERAERDVMVEAGERPKLSRRPDEGIVLIDCPAVFSSAAIIRLLPYVDGVLLVIRDGQRSKSDVQRAISMIEGASGRLLGAIVNKRQYVIPEWLYSIVAG